MTYFRRSGAQTASISSSLRTPQYQRVWRPTEPRTRRANAERAASTRRRSRRSPPTGRLGKSAVDKPADLFDRDAEWQALDEFVRASGPGLRLGVVYGRRRQGKSFLLRRLVDAAGGLYLMPLEEERAPALRRFADQPGESALGLPPGNLRFDSWEPAFRAAFAALPRVARPGAPPVVVVDELPYLLALYHSVLAAIAGGAGAPSQIGAAIGRPAPSLAHPLAVLQTAGFAERVEDVLRQRRARPTLADPSCVSPPDHRATPVRPGRAPRRRGVDRSRHQIQRQHPRASFRAAGVVLDRQTRPRGRATRAGWRGRVHGCQRPGRPRAP
jgi:hypothetical protein